MQGGTAVPEHRAVIVDEAHELVARVTGAASGELSPQQVERVGKRAVTFLSDETALDLLESADELRTALDESPLERVEDPSSTFVAAAQRVRAAARAAVSGLTTGGEKPSPEQRQAAAAVGEVLDVAERMAALSAYDVVWVSERERSGREARVAPLSVAGLMRSSVFGERTVVLTSATLKLGDDFGPSAGSLGLRAKDRDDAPAPYVPAGGEDESGADVVPWRGLDVGSPFDYRHQAIRYVARTLPTPGREGMSKEVLDEIAELVWAAGGRTLGLFSSRRAAEAAAVHVRRQLPKMTVLCQGDAQLSELTRRFTAEETTSLFGTLSLWQGVDVPGRDLPAGDHRPDPVPAARRAAHPRPAEGGGRRGRQRLHERRGDARRAAPRPGFGPAGPAQQRPGRRRGARPAARHGALRVVPARRRCRTCGRPPTARSRWGRSAAWPRRRSRSGPRLPARRPR